MRPWEGSGLPPNMELKVAELCLASKNELLGGIPEAIKAVPEDPMENFTQITLWEGTEEEPSYKLSIDGVASYLMARYQFLAFRDTQELYYYNGQSYTSEVEPLIKEAVKKVLKDVEGTVGSVDILRTSHIREIVLQLQALNFSDRIEPPTCLIPLANGVLDTDPRLNGEYELLPVGPSYFFTWRLPVAYDPKADCPSFKRFLGQILAPSDVLAVQEFFGYCLARHHDYHKAFMLIGDGANGKSTLLGVLRAFLGPKNCASISLQNMEVNQFAAAGLVDKLANIYPDLSDRAMATSGIFKALTGGVDAISAERKYKESAPFVNTAKLIFSCNKLPEVKDDTSAFFRRWVVLDFPNRFPPQKADPKLSAKLTTPEELSGILNWAIEGLLRLEAAGMFSGAMDADDMAAMYVRMSNSLAAFLEDCVVREPTSCVGKEDLYNAYVAYCHAKKLPAKSKDKLGKDLPSLVQTITLRPQEGGLRVWSWGGLKLLDTSSAPQETKGIVQRTL